ncbi:MAG: helix-turn-helix transcriptional regulator [Oscillibacter sp.]|nr:helix-turn-helix transcriptional regulator [Oscillibacter sp.]
MNLNEGLAASIRALMKQKHMSLSEFSEEVGVSRSSLHTYTKGEGNPSTGTINHMAQRLGISPAVLANGLMDLDHREIALLLLDTIQGVAELPEGDRLKMAELFLEMVKLWNRE